MNKLQIISSLFWKLMERGGTQSVQFIVQIILARLLLPEDFGLLALVLVFINLANVFVQRGFNTALIQKKDADNLDFSSVFYLSIMVAGLLYITIFLSSPIIAVFYENLNLIPVLRVLSIMLILGAVNSIQIAYLARNMMFKKLFFSSFGAMVFSGVVGITMAYWNWGVWALVTQQLTNQLSVTVILWLTLKWRPQLVFSLKRLKLLFSFGWKLLASSLLDTLYMDLRTIIVGKIYNSAILGFYNRGQQFPQAIVTNIDGSIQSVMLPALSSHQDNKTRVKEMMRRAIVTSSFLIFPMMVGMAVVAKPLVEIVLTEKWLPAVPFLQIFCISYALMPIHTANLQAINSIGRSDIFLRLEIIKKVMGLTILGISLPFGVYAIALGQIASSFIATIINAYPNKQLLDYSYKEQMIDIMPSFLIAAAMGGMVYFVNYLSFAVWQILCLQVVIGIVVYFGFAILFKIESFNYLVTTIKEILRTRTGVRKTW